VGIVSPKHLNGDDDPGGDCVRSWSSVFWLSKEGKMTLNAGGHDVGSCLSGLGLRRTWSIALWVGISQD